MSPKTLRLCIMLCLVLVLAAATLSAATSADVHYFTGEDFTGDFQAALENAVQEALAAAPCCDRRIAYKVVKIKGTAGGLSPVLATIEVTIRVDF